MQITQILVDCYFDSEKAELVHGQRLFTVSEESGLIHQIAALSENNDSAILTDNHESEVIDLRGLVVLPGFVDTHVHCQSST